MVIDAIRLLPENMAEVLLFCGNCGISNDPHKGLTICTLEGAVTASWGDWIIRGVMGELYPCKPNIFIQTYEPVE